MKKSLLLIAAIAALLSETLFAAGSVTVVGKGDGYDRTQAVYAALADALVQVSGVTMVEAQRIVSTDSRVATYVSSGSDSSRTTTVSSGGSKTSDINAQGRIKAYRVLSEELNKVGRYLVTVEAEVEKPYEDPAQNNRRRMAIVAFRTKGDTFVCRGETVGTGDWSQTLADRLNTQLVQTRKFNVLERKFDQEIDEELARILAKNAAKEDYQRLNRKLATDYLVTGEITFLPEVLPTEHPITHQIIWPKSAPFAEITYRVILAPTGQLKWIDTVKVDAVAYQNLATRDEYLSAVAEEAAIKIADAIMADILPFKIEAVLPSGRVVIGEGGKSLVPGEILTVYATGDEIFDSDTGDFIDVVEEPVGAVLVTEVMPKLSYANVIEGDISRMEAGSRLRRPKTISTGSEEASTPPPVSTTKQKANGAVVLPF